MMIDNKEIAEHQNVIDSGYDQKQEKCWINLVDKKDDLSQMEALLDDYFDYSLYSFNKHGFKCEQCKE